MPKNLLIIYPHWPPSNLAGVHRPRLIANFIHEFGWQPTVLTVDAAFYEEKPDADILKTVSPFIKVIYVNAFKPLGRFRFFGDIGLRSFYQLYKGALKIIGSTKIDFIWIPVPSFYVAVLGRLLHAKTGIPYGIDYIDPWVDGFTNHSRLFSKAWLSNILAKILEPYSVKKASLISGVSTSYYQPVLDRNFRNKAIHHLGMPYGFDPKDHALKIGDLAFPWEGESGCIPLVYAGAFLPKSHLFIDTLFKVISNLQREGKWDPRVHLYFLGTGSYPGKTIRDYALQYGIARHVHESPARYPFLHILNFLSASAGVMVIGSTEKHYTASKIFQALLSQKPVFAIFHKQSTAAAIMLQACAEAYLCTFEERQSPDVIEHSIAKKFDSFLDEVSGKSEKSWSPVLEALAPFSSRQSALLLAEQLDLICPGP
jgi:hypothetical protein